MRNLAALLFIILFSDACVDRLIIDSGEGDAGTLVVDGVVTDQQGPYTVKLLRSSSADDILNFGQPVAATQVTLFDNVGTVEIMKPQGNGIYQSDPNGIHGQVGRKYHIRIELVDGTIFESLPDEMMPPGEIDSLYFEFESYLPRNNQTQYGFRLFFDAQSVAANTFVRWRFSGNYVFKTYPEMHLFYNGCFGPPDPLPCSGFIYTGSFMKRVGECTCCNCWVNDYENSPHLSDEKIVTNGTYKKVELGFVPFDEVTFSQGKYMVRLEQMSLSRNAYEYWKIIRDQKEGASSLFQPSFGKIGTNFYSPNSNKEVAGIFYASAVKKRVTFIKAQDSPIPVPEPSVDPTTVCIFWFECDKPFISASRTPPSEWE